MKDIFILLLLLIVQVTEVCSDPYKADSSGKCRDPKREYKKDDSGLCCQKCPPGHRLREVCSETTETVCEPCKPDTYSENWNYAPNCLSCTKCKTKKGLQTAQVCNSTQNSKCECQPGRFCAIGFEDSYCTDCIIYTKCKPGQGVILPVKPDRDVQCEPCLNGTVFDQVSLISLCQPLSSTGSPTTSKTTTTTAADSKSTRSSTQSAGASVSSTPPPVNQLVAVVAGVVGSLFLFGIVMLLLFFCRHRRKDTIIINTKVDPNGNCETIEKDGQNNHEESKMMPVTLPEQQCLLENGEAGSTSTGCGQSQYSKNCENVHITPDYISHDYSNHDSSSSLQPTLAFNSPISALSAPMTLLSNTEAFSPQPSLTTQCSSQPTSPQIISPVTNSPHVNVNITLHIGNGSCGSPSLKPTDLSEAEFKLPFGQEEESFSNPEQEAGSFSKISPETQYCSV